MAARKPRVKQADEIPVDAQPEPAIDDTPPPPNTNAFDTVELGQQAERDDHKRWTDQGPRGIAVINLGGGRHIHFIRKHEFQQVGIRITADDGVDPRPSKEDTQFLKDNGFRWRGGADHLWTRQFFTPEDKDRVAAIESEKGAEQAKLERNRLRVAVMREAEGVFADLGNSIRARNGLEPTQPFTGQNQSRGA